MSAYSPVAAENLKYKHQLTKGNLTGKNMYQYLSGLKDGKRQGYYFGFEAQYAQDGANDTFELFSPDTFEVIAILRIKGGLKPEMQDGDGMITGPELEIKIGAKEWTSLNTIAGGKRRHRRKGTKRVRRARRHQSRRR
jgi:hypothetical protein